MGVLTIKWQEMTGLLLVILLILLSILTANSYNSAIDINKQNQTSRTRINIDNHWLFYPNDESSANKIDFQDNQWRTLNLPHDWSIEGEYDKDNPSGIHGGFLPTGIGWYRKHLAWNNSWTDKRIMIEFDGVYMNSEVWVNGHSVGLRPYGYISFSYDITDYLTKENNVIAVRVDNSKSPSGRWYTGSGIYRHVWLTTVKKQHIPYSGVFVRSENVTKQQADLKITTEIKNSDSSAQTLQLQTQLLNDDGKVVAETKSKVEINSRQTVTIDQAVIVNKPELWSIEKPYLYTLRSTLLNNGKVIDVFDTSTGIRSIAFTAKQGFLLNGQPIILQGTSMHHDAGPVGAAVPDDVLRRRLETLKKMGVNAIRTTHNPFAPEFYQMADEMGFVLMNEAFDGWWKAKAKYDYGLYFDDWWQRDLTDFIRRDRNHPSVIMWSIGNEVPKYTPEQQKIMVEFTRQIDDTRPITQGGGYAAGHLNIAGFNGHGEFKNVLQTFHKEKPDVPIIGTEMTHTIHTRGIYRSKTSYRVRDFPAPWEIHQPQKKWQKINSKVYQIPDLTGEEVFPGITGAYGSSYDNSVVRMPIREEIKLARELPYFLGTFRWTAFDYLGESFGWPARTANFGVIDLAGFPKGPYYLYQSQWNKAPMVHLDPHWTHPGKEGIEIPVVVYTNQQSAELFLNGKSLGDKVMGEKMQLLWLVPYEAGSLKVVAKSNEKEIVSKTIHTASEPTSTSISVDKLLVTANQHDVVHLEIDVVDEKGHFVPSAANRLNFNVTGPGRLIGVENGDILDLEPHKVPTRKAFMGKVLALIQATDKAGDIKVTVSGEGLKSQQVVIKSQPLLYQ